MASNLRYKNIPIILCSGYADSITIVKAMKLGAMDFPVKPFTVDNVIPKVKNAISHGKQKILIVEDEQVILDK